MEIKRDTLIFQNIKCEFFPCITNIKLKDFNCKFCYCPLYLMPMDCQGDYTYTEDGIKDCTNCYIVHNGLYGIEFIHKKIKNYLDNYYVDEEKLIIYLK